MPHPASPSPTVGGAANTKLWACASQRLDPDWSIHGSPPFCLFAGRAVRSLEHALNKQAGNFPGVVAKRIDSNVLTYEAQKILDTAVVTTGTNGKTTTNNLLASCMEAAGNEVFCNREGSNLETGVITALLDKRKAPFALLECDEMYTRFVLPKVHPRLFCLLNLFPGDQIYRFGSMERIFDAVADPAMVPPKRFW